MRPQTKAVKVIPLRRSTAIIVLGFIFGVLAALFAGYVDLRQLHSFDERVGFEVCVGANDQVRKVVEKLMEPTPLTEDMTSGQRQATIARNERAVQTREELRVILEETKLECDRLLKANR